jgi:UDP-N-acetylglucosamine acyltransferase
MNDIHPTAVVEKGAELDGVTVGPFSVVKAGVHIGKGTVLHGHCWIEGDTVLGQNNQVLPFASIGTPPQDLKYAGEPTRVRIGDSNIFRENSTIHRGTAQGHMETKIGSRCMIMGSAHIAHDCSLGNNVIMSQGAALAGHVEVGDFVIMGGMVGVHQFSRIGERSFLSAGTMVAQDVPPFCLAEGRRAGLVGINVIGLKRAGFSQERVMAIRRMYKEFYKIGATRADAIAAAEAIPGEDVKLFLDFVKASTRGVLRPRREYEGPEDDNS